jgi:hypothetical protein
MIRCSRCKHEQPATAFCATVGTIRTTKVCQDCRSSRSAERQEQAARAEPTAVDEAPAEDRQPIRPEDLFDRVPRAFNSQYRRRKQLDLGRMDIECRDCGALHWLAEKTFRSPKSAPMFSKCCKEGAVKLPPVKEPPPELKELFTSQEPDAVDFRKNIRSYNSAFAFTSLSYTADNRTTGGFMPFQIQGQLCHLHGPLLPNNSGTAANAQVWFYDTEMANSSRSSLFPKTRGPILGMLTDVLHRCNPYICLYKTAREQLLQLESRCTPVTVLLTPELRLVQEVGADRRRENLPTASEVAAIIPDIGPGWHERTFRDMHLRLRSAVPGTHGLDRVDPSHGGYLPLQYVLLFPWGDQGWHWNLRLQDRNPENQQEDQDVDRTPINGLQPAQQGNPVDTNDLQDYSHLAEDDIDPDLGAEVTESRKTGRLTMRNFHAYRLFPRRGDFNTILRGGRLLQQYVVDAWATIDQTTLRWIFHHQTELRADLYNGVADTAAIADTNSDQIGKRIILPSSYVGGDRFMHTIFQDCMAIVGYFGRPSLFITFTANPNWAEIRAELFPGQTPQDRPDIVARVFHMKAKMLREEICRDSIFGHAIARVWCIEYQKRGLPHMHMLVFLENRRVYLQPEIIDEIISAEIPPSDWNNDPELAELVKSVLIHGPCGQHDPNATCMVKDDKTGRVQCNKRFPKDFMDETVVQENGYPNYRRRDDPNTAFTRVIKGKEVRIDNRWVVPHNRYLTSRYKAHINVEICASIDAIKYICKYIYKGADRTTLRIDSEDDEVNLYLQCRYCGPTEGCWRIFEYRTHEESPNVVKLPVHLPDQQVYTFKKDDTTECRADRKEASRSKLMAFFDWNKDLPDDAPRRRYSEMPKHCVWLPKSRKWKIRQNSREAIGRMYHCTPNQGERFYLRLLLTVKAGPTSFEDLRTVDGELLPTFKAACQAMGLLEDDREWMLTFEEAAAIKTGAALRSLFVVALLHGSLAEPKALWEQFRAAICDDLPHRLSRLDDWPETSSQRSAQQWDYGLWLLSQMLQESHNTLTEFGMDEPTTNWGPIISAVEAEENDTAVRERFRTTAEEMYRMFNDDQRAVFDRITEKLYEQPQFAHFYVQGAGGTGKTFLYRALHADARSKGLTVLCVASSGIAAVLLPDGRTAHSQFRIPLNVDDNSVCDIKLQSKLARLLTKVGLVIWDEVPMTNRRVFEAVDRTLRDITKEEDMLFGGIPFVLGGDFAQTLPVIKRGKRADIVAATLPKSYIWEKLECERLRINMRLQGGGINAEFAAWLGRMSYDPDLQGSIELLSLIQRAWSEADLCERVFPAATLANIDANSDFFASRAILAIRNADLTEINATLMGRLPNEAETLYSVDAADTDDTGEGHEEFTREFLQSIDLPGLPPSILQLKVGAPIMLLRNLRPQEGLCNGTRLVVKKITKHIVHARILTGDYKGNECLIPRIVLFTLECDLPFILSRRQFPVRPCFAMTVNKSQGQSLETVGIDLRNPAFSHGQLYVALSRVMDVRRLTVLLPDDRLTTDNIVFPEVLEDWMR